MDTVYLFGNDSILFFYSVSCLVMVIVGYNLTRYTIAQMEIIILKCFKMCVKNRLSIKIRTIEIFNCVSDLCNTWEH